MKTTELTDMSDQDNELLRTVTRATPEHAGKSEIGIAGVESLAPVSVVAMSVWRMILVRVCRVYLQVFLGLLGAEGMGIIDLGPAGEAWVKLQNVALISLAPACVSLMQNALEFLTRLDVNKPTWRA